MAAKIILSRRGLLIKVRYKVFKKISLKNTLNIMTIDDIKSVEYL
jgi:hypothetical protein